MKPTLLLFISVFWLFFLGCQRSGEEKTDIPKSVIDEFESYKLSIDGPHTRFTNMVDHVELMKLEETDKSLLSSVALFLESEDEYFVGNYRDSGLAFFRFTKNGEFVSEFDRSGEGPEEYGSPNMVWVQDGLLSFHQKYKKLIKQYDFNENYVRTIRIPEVADQVVSLGDGYALDMNHSMLEDSLRYDVFVYDKDFRLVNQFIPYDKGYDGFRMSSDFNGFFPYKDGYTYIRTMSDSLFFINEKGMSSLAKFDFGNSWIWNTGAKKPGFGPPNEDAPTIVRSIGVFSHSDWFYLRVFGNRPMRNPILLDRKTGKYQWIDFKTDEGEVYYLTPVRTVEDRLLASISSDNVSTFLSQLGQEQYSFVSGTTLEEIESSENPVMMWVKFKDNFN